MGYMTSKFKGKFQLRTEHDIDSLSFPTKDSNIKDSPKIEDEIYINCRIGKICHYGGSTMVAYIEPLNNYRSGKFKERYLESGDLKKPLSEFDDLILLAETEEDTIKESNKKKAYIKSNYNKDGSEKEFKEYETLRNHGQIFNKVVKKLGKNAIKGSVLKTDIGGSVMFNLRHTKLVAEIMGAYTSKRTKSPFAVEYLREIRGEEYIIPVEDLELLKEATPKTDNSNRYKISQAYKSFAEENNIDMKLLKSKDNLKDKELLHKYGYFDDLIEYLKATIV